MAEKAAVTLTYQHNKDDSYNDDPDDGVEALQTEIHQICMKYEEEDGGNKPPAKQQRRKQQNDNKEDDDKNHATKQK